MATYSWRTFSQAQGDLLDRLQDPTGAHWSHSQIYLQEALRSWNALTSQSRGTMTLTLGASVNWYDLSSITGTVRPYTITGQDLFTEIGVQLLEDANYPTWGGSLQFNSTDVLIAIQSARDEVFSLTGCFVATVNFTNVSSNVVVLSDFMIDVRRVFFASSDGSTCILREADALSREFFSPGYIVRNANGGANPRTYARSDQPPRSLQLDSIKSRDNRLEVLATCDFLTRQGVAGLLGVPDDWAWVVKWGALAQLLGREGNAKDAPRAEYCLYRYNQGISLMCDMQVVLSGVMNGSTPLQIDGVRNGDDFNPSWQSGAKVNGRAYIAGPNLIGFSDPGGTPVTVTLNVVQNMPVSNAYIQVGREDYMAILDEAQHLASFEMGGQDFIQTMPLHKRFMDRAALYNSKLMGLGDYPGSLFDQSNTEEQRNPVYGSKKPADILK